MIGIDYGTKRVGVAVTDDGGAVAFPRMVLPNNRTLMGDLAAFIAKEGVGAVVIGESVGPTGDNPVMKDIRIFARELKRETGLPVHFEGEYLSSVEARRTSATPIIDAEAAAIILNSYLTKKHGNHH